VSAGVSVAFSAASTGPGGTLQLTVTNTGSIGDTFDFVLGGAAVISAKAAVSSVSLAPGGSTNVAVTIGACQRRQATYRCWPWPRRGQTPR
jgi:hypothetical protein